MKPTVMMLMLFAACSQPAPTVTTSQPSPADTSAQPPATPTQPAAAAPSMVTTAQASAPRVIFPDGYEVELEIAADDELRAQGLMYRDQLRPDSGMLFIFPQDGQFSFWMRNTRIPLDMIWIDKDHRVVDAKFHVPPCRTRECPSYTPSGTGRYVLEVAGGVAEAHGIKPGDQLRMIGLEGIVAR